MGNAVDGLVEVMNRSDYPEGLIGFRAAIEQKHREPLDMIQPFLRELGFDVTTAESVKMFLTIVISNMESVIVGPATDFESYELPMARNNEPARDLAIAYLLLGGHVGGHAIRVESIALKANRSKKWVHLSKSDFARALLDYIEQNAEAIKRSHRDATATDAVDQNAQEIQEIVEYDDTYAVEPESETTDPHLRKRRMKRIAFSGILCLCLGLLLSGAYMSRTPGYGGISVGLMIAAIVLVIVASLVNTALDENPVEYLNPEEIGERLMELASAIEIEWSAEEQARGIHGPTLLPVRWHRAEPIPVSADGSPGAGLIALAGALDDVVDAYERIASGRLVVLGAPGAGKTVVLTRLVLDLLADWHVERPVPVLLSAASWGVAKNESLNDWLDNELQAYKPGLKPHVAPGVSIARQLINDGRILPVIDGFDEMGSEARASFLEALNEEPKPFVLSSRGDEYRQMATGPEAAAPNGAAVIELEPLSADEVAAYLTSTAVGGTDTAERTVTWQATLTRIGEDHEARLRFGELFDSPLMVFLAQSIYSQATIDPAELLDTSRFSSVDHVRQYLFAKFLEVSYSTTRYHPDSAIRWLTFLAEHLDGRSIIWWQLPNSVAWYWRSLVFGIVFGAFGCAFGAAMCAEGHSSQTFIWVAAAFGLLAGVLYGSWPTVMPAQMLDFPSLFPSRWIHKITCPIGGAVAALIARPLVDVFHGWWSPLAWAPLLIGAPIGALVVSSIEGSRGQGVTGARTGRRIRLDDVPAWLGGASIVVVLATFTHASTGSLWIWLVIGVIWGLFMDLAFMPAVPIGIESANGFRETLRSTRWFMLYFVMMTSIAYGVVLGSLVGPVAGAIAGMIIGTSFGIAIHGQGKWLLIGRGWLPLTRKLPLAVVGFIEDAYGRQILRRAGVAYQFRHDLLRKAIVNETRAN